MTKVPSPLSTHPMLQLLSCYLHMFVTVPEPHSYFQGADRTGDHLDDSLLLLLRVMLCGADVPRAVLCHGIHLAQIFWSYEVAWVIEGCFVASRIFGCGRTLIYTRDVHVRAGRWLSFFR